MRSSTFWIIVGIGALLIVAGGVGVAVLTRAERNNNPLNIRESSDGGDQWQGERASDDDADFEEFETIEAGYRAAAKILRKYFYTYKLATIAAMIGRWAPPSENDTGAYIVSVLESLKKAGYTMGGGQVMNSNAFERILPHLLDAMTRVEVGRQPWTLAQIEAGISQA